MQKDWQAAGATIRRGIAGQAIPGNASKHCSEAAPQVVTRKIRKLAMAAKPSRT
ncbi:hypothetical protein AB4Z48_37930 [Cupriavidus sp. 2TAF22]|uniref:hypothetical protein n=1 Tax=unclassified Cupriavidus TaxID=2640874 RepID=UPI003F90901A